MGKLDQRVAIVTGGGTGIGRNVALEFAKAGADVAICSRNRANLEKTAEEIESLGRRSLAVPTDVSVVEQVRNMVKKAVDKFGRIDILVNNSGTSRRALIVDMTEDDWDDVLATNLKGAFLCTQAVVRYMMEQKYGKIINISSLSGIRNTHLACANYNASKAGIIQLTRDTAAELGPYGINTNCIAPGAVETPAIERTRTPEQVQEWKEGVRKVTPMGRIGNTQDIANLALFLASDDSSFMCGETVVMDGGRNARTPSANMVLSSNR